MSMAWQGQGKDVNAFAHVFFVRKEPGSAD